MSQRILAMYDVRGIQNYIFRTAKVKDAIGASLMVENIIRDALQESAGKNAIQDWCDQNGPLPFAEDCGKPVEILFIGGGNAYVLFDSEERCREISRKMSRYVLDRTYSLQLAVAYVPKSEDYADDYRELKNKMSQVKAGMVLSRPYGALPVMQAERKTGFPLVTETESTETKNKKDYKDRRAAESEDEKIFDRLIQQKGVDSTLAVVHIDGNNMGLRILNLISGKKTYGEAVKVMRAISWQISSSFRRVFDDMMALFNERSFHLEEFAGKEFRPFIRRIVTAGDDITYVCTAKIALATVQYFSREISKYTLNGGTGPEDRKTYGFSVCAGIAYIGSHFPFSIGYDVAESCCENAKEMAKKPEHRDGDRVGNFVDFQICKNIQARSLEKMRAKEYRTWEGQSLLLRPYYIETDSAEGFAHLAEEPFRFEAFREAAAWFSDEKKIPRSFAKQLRNMYSQGRKPLETWDRFLLSRGWKIPADPKTGGCFFNDRGQAIWYDALEMLDYYLDLERFVEKE